ncbi:MAG: hypothetical protein ACI9YH_000034 [Colwellia sp.]
MHSRLGARRYQRRDFETFSLFDSSVRGWLFDRENMSINHLVDSGQHGLAKQLKSTEYNIFSK